MGKETVKLSKGVLSANFFLAYKKKLAALFIIAVMFINGFMPNAVNISKNSLIMVAASAACEMVVTMFKQCNDSVADMSKQITESLVNFLRSSDTSDKFSENKQQSSGQVPDGAGGQTERAGRQILAERTSNDLADITLSAGYKFYYDFAPQIPSGENGTGGTIPILLAFILFIIGFISRKGIENNTIINIFAIKKALCVKHKVFLIAGRTYEK
jgi:hypothetical protein